MVSKNEGPTRFAYHHGQTQKVVAQVAGEALVEIERRNGAITPKAVVDESRPEDAPLHPCFEWDDEAAAEEYRQIQARGVIRSVRVLRTREDGKREKQVAFVSIRRADENGDPKRGYVQVKHCSAEELREQVVAEALAALDGWKRRYGHLRELADLVEQLESAQMQPA